MEATYIFINRWMDKEDVVDIYLDYYLTIKNEIMLFAATMDGPRDYHIKWSKPDRQIYDST